MPIVNRIKLNPGGQDKETGIWNENCLLAFPKFKKFKFMLIHSAILILN